jgi:PAS domain S-box-containing protein
MTQQLTNGVLHSEASYDSRSDEPPDEGIFRLLMEFGPEAMMLSRADGVITYLNAPAAAILGRPSSEIIGRTLADFTHSDDVVELHRTIKTSLDNAGRSVSSQVRFATTNRRSRVN